MGSKVHGLRPAAWPAGMRTIETKPLGSVYLLSQLLEGLGIDRVFD